MVDVGRKLTPTLAPARSLGVWNWTLVRPSWRAKVETV
jgi:hypothetical protein